MPANNKFATKYAIAQIAVISLWLYLSVVNDLLTIFEIPKFALALTLFALVGGVHFALTRNSDKNKAAISADAVGAKSYWMVVFGTIAVIGLSIGLSLVTVTLVDADYRREFSSYVTKCDRDTSAVKQIPVGTTTTLANGASMTVHSVAYNVPQISEKPQEENAWYCTEATAVEVTIENLPDTESDAAMSYSNFYLKGVSPHLSGEVSDISAESSPELYALDTLEAKNTEILELRFLPGGATSSRGWLVFTVAEDASNASSELLYKESRNVLGVVKLPSEK